MSKYVVDDYRNLIEAYSKAEVNELRKGKTVTLLANGWSGLSQRVAVSGMSVNDNPIVDIKLSSNQSQSVNELWEWTKIIRAETSDGFITFYAESRPTIDLNVIINGMSLDAQDISFLPISTEDRTSYEGQIYPTLKEKDDADVDFLLGRINGTEAVVRQTELFDEYNHRLERITADIAILKVINNLSIENAYNTILGFYKKGFWGKEYLEIALNKQVITETEYNIIIQSLGE